MRKLDMVFEMCMDIHTCMHTDTVSLITVLCTAPISEVIIVYSDNYGNHEMTTVLLWN